jgi:hypothetical protein
MKRRTVAAGLLALAGLLNASFVTAEQAVRAIYHTEIEQEVHGSTTRRRALEWQFERGSNFVEISAPADQLAERWVRDEAGRIWYARIFHAERKIIEYQPSDLALAAVAQKWETIRSVIDPKALSSLQVASDQKSFNGEPAALYRGKLDSADAEVWWLAAAGLPVYVHKRTGAASSTMRLMKLERTATPRVAQPLNLQYEGYDILDFSDLGDRHHDPFVEKLMKYEGLWFGHGH